MENLFSTLATFFELLIFSCLLVLPFFTTTIFLTRYNRNCENTDDNRMIIHFQHHPPSFSGKIKIINLLFSISINQDRVCLEELDNASLCSHFQNHSFKYIIGTADLDAG